MMDILSRDKPLILDVRQNGSGPVSKSGYCKPSQGPSTQNTRRIVPDCIRGSSAYAWVGDQRRRSRPAARAGKWGHAPSAAPHVSPRQRRPLIGLRARACELSARLYAPAEERDPVAARGRDAPPRRPRVRWSRCSRAGTAHRQPCLSSGPRPRFPRGRLPHSPRASPCRHAGPRTARARAVHRVRRGRCLPWLPTRPAAKARSGAAGHQTRRRLVGWRARRPPASGALTGEKRRAEPPVRLGGRSR